MSLLLSSQFLVIALTIGVASGVIGAFVVLKRMALVGDALSHVALPGIALALAYHVDPFWGVVVFLLTAAVIVWWLEGKTTLPADAIVGLLFTASLAVGILTIPDTEILESLFGAFPVLSPAMFFFIVGAAVILTMLVFLLARHFLFSIVSPDLSMVEDGHSRRDALILFILFACVVSLGIKLVGTLLMGALTIIPAAVAKNISRTMAGYIIFSALLGGLIAVGGVLIAHAFHILPGPPIILLGIVFFLVTLPFLRK